MRRQLRPTEIKTLLASRNVLRTAASKYAYVVSGAEYNFGTNNFTFGLMFSADSDGVTILEASHITIYLSGGKVVAYVDAIGTLTDTQDYVIGSFARVTIIRTTTDLYLVVNGRVAASMAHANIPLDMSGVNIYYGGTADGLLGQLFVIANDLTILEAESLHSTCVIPKRVHIDVIAHYTFNQPYGDVVWDVVEQYNYAKVTPLVCNHATLVNYTADDTGVTNPITQTVWVNIYTKLKKGEFFWKGDNVTSYAECVSFAGVTYPDFSIAFCFIPPDDDQYSGFPNNQSNIFSNDTFGDPNYVSVRTGFGTGNYEVLFGAGSGISGGPASPGKMSFGIVTYDGTTLKIFTNSAGPSNSFAVAGLGLFDNMSFTKEISKVASGLGKFILLDKVVNSTEMEMLFRALKTDNESYKRISNIQIDLNFGDIFLVGPDYFARDSSGNNRHAQLYNWTTASLPATIYQNSQLSVLKALQFKAAFNQYLQSPFFSYSIPGGATYLVGFLLDSDRDFTGNELFWTTGASFLYGKNGSRDFQVVMPQEGGYQSGNLKKMDTPQFIGFTSTDDEIITLANGFAQDSHARSNPLANETSDLFIGGGALANFNGYMFHFSVWDRVLSKAEILNIVNNEMNGLNAPNLAGCRMWIDFSRIIDNAGTPQLRDLSADNRAVVLTNYSSAEIDPTDPAYAIVDVDTLR